MIVVGVVDDSLSDRLQPKADLTLKMAVQMSRQAEVRKQNKDLIRGSTTSETATASTHVDLVEPHKKDMKSAIKPEDGVWPKSKRKCMWSGGQQHKRQSCPAKDVTCNSCQLSLQETDGAMQVHQRSGRS